jgi:hypothetical protein
VKLVMRGPYRLEASAIDANVAKASVGNYVLGRQDSDTGEFVVDYVGRADSGVNAKLKSWIGKTDAPLFMFSYAVSRRVAFAKECRLYHELSPPDNDAHPERLPGVDWTCPVCDALGRSRRSWGGERGSLTLSGGDRRSEV